MARSDYEVPSDWRPRKVMGKDFWHVLGVSMDTHPDKDFRSRISGDALLIGAPRTGRMRMHTAGNVAAWRCRNSYAAPRAHNRPCRSATPLFTNNGLVM